MDEAERGLQELLVDRLAADDVPGRVADLILGAWESEDSLATVIAGGHYTGTEEPGSARPGRRGPEVFLGAVHVEGFRGIGGLATLPLRPGPVLTLVTGRNGSGKSSFAEAAELALTGSSARWSGRTAVWREGWRNLHTTGSTRVAVDLLVSGQAGATSITRRWGPDEGLDDGQWTRQRHGKQIEVFDGSDWGEDMRTYRPFLSYGELGALIDGRPSDLHDALHRLLGLGPLSTAQDRLLTKAKQLSDEVKSVGADRRALRDACLGVDDERAQRAAALLKPTSPDLDAVATLALGTDDDAVETAVLRRITALELPETTTVDAAVTAVRRASERHTALTTVENRAAHDAAALVRAALHHHDARGEGPCPVCGEGTLDAGWRDQAQQRADEMERAAAELRDATASLETALAQARDLVRPVPTSLTHTAPVNTNTAREAWQHWSDAVRSAQPDQMADALTSTHPAALRALTELQQRAVQELSHR
ncbi:MAG: AAA family ATPase, partial [Pseudonocardiaceae bacterium]